MRSYILRSVHKNLQRLSSLAFCLAKASPSRPGTASQVAKPYEELITRRYEVREDALDRVAAYIGERALVQKYGGKKGATVETVRNKIKTGKTIEIQDWFLSDPALPSKTGAEKEQSFVKTVSSCQELELLGEKTLTLRTYGELLRAVAENRGLFRAFEEPEQNPFSPDPPYVAAAFLQVLRHDLVFQREILRRVGEVETSFVDVAGQLHEILRDVQAGTPRSVANRAMHAWLEKQRAAAAKLKARLSGSDKPGPLTYTLYRPLEDLLYSRLEFLVDFGALEKPDPGRYAYRRTAAYHQLARLVNGGEDMVTDGYFAAFAASHGKSPKRLVDVDAILGHLRIGYDKFKNVAGYAPILECTVYANVARWDEEPWAIAEVGDAFGALAELARDASPRVRINPDRFRRPFTFKIVE